MREYEYDVTLSFAGEDRTYAEALAELLKNDGYEVFYDKYEWARLWAQISMMNSPQFTRIKHDTASCLYPNIMPKSYGRIMNARLFRRGHFKKAKHIFFRSCLTIRRFRGFCPQSGIWIYAQCLLKMFIRFYRRNYRMAHRSHNQSINLHFCRKQCRRICAVTFSKWKCAFPFVSRSTQGFRLEYPLKFFQNRLKTLDFYVH